MEAIHTEFGIRRKTVRTTTDSGSNFVKAFSVFGKQETGDDDGESTDESEDDDVGSVSRDVAVDLDSLLSNVTSYEYELPCHLRCAAHALNLVSTSDADKAETDAAYKKISRSAFAKCQALWNKYGRSALAVEAVTDTLELGLKRPNETRWNSVFLAVERLLRIVADKGEQQLDSVCNKIGVPRLTAGELAFLTEYVAVMKPVAQALNIMQAEKNMFLGYLLPTITVLRDKLVSKRASVTMCAPLVSALIDGIDNRFAEAFDDAEVAAAAVLHAKFKTSWTTNAIIIQKATEHIQRLRIASYAEHVSSEGNGADDEDDEQAFFRKKANDPSPQHALEQYLHSPSDEPNSIASWPQLKELFIRLNTPLPASAAVERLFSTAGLVMSHKRVRLNDRNFENLVFVKANQWLTE
jgi:hypothetical protein